MINGSETYENPHFQMREDRVDRRVTISLVGELDLAGAPSLEDRLGELESAGEPVRLDLSRLTFIDSTGIKVLIRALMRARRDGWELEVAPRLTPPVSRVLKLVRVDHLLFGEDNSAPT
ncbi:MAG: STAS domain-containing protein [Solirubrobacteraceae bacterium]